MSKQRDFWIKDSSLEAISETKFDNGLGVLIKGVRHEGYVHVREVSPSEETEASVLRTIKGLLENIDRNKNEEFIYNLIEEFTK